MAAWKLAPALAAGCTIVLKPAEQTPLTALPFGELVCEVGFPAGVVNIVAGYGRTVGGALVAHPLVDKIGSPGSTVVGRQIAATTAAAIKRVTFEFGGKSQNIVFGDSVFADATRGAAAAIFSNAGQSCSAGSRICIESSSFAAVVEALSDARRWFLRRPDGARGRYRRHAGRTRGDLGPVVVALPCDFVDDVAGRANNTPYCLAAGVWTRDVVKANRMARLLRAGTVYVNTYGHTDAAAPFGGFKESGFGREVGHVNLDAYLETKTIWTSVEQ